MLGCLQNTVLLFACLYFMGKIDFADPDNLWKLRVTYGAVQVGLLAVWALLYFLIRKAAQRSPVHLPSGEVTTVEAYDLAQLRKFVQSFLFGAGISTFIHYKFGVAPPLFVQSVTGPFQTFQNPLVRLYLMGDRSPELVHRPWKEPANPLAALLGGDQQQAPVSPPQTEEQTVPRVEEITEDPKSSPKLETEKKDKEGLRQDSKKESQDEKKEENKNEEEEDQSHEAPKEEKGVQNEGKEKTQKQSRKQKQKGQGKASPKPSTQAEASGNHEQIGDETETPKEHNIKSAPIADEPLDEPEPSANRGIKKRRAKAEQ